MASSRTPRQDYSTESPAPLPNYRSTQDTVTDGGPRSLTKAQKKNASRRVHLDKLWASTIGRMSEKMTMLRLTDFLAPSPSRNFSNLPHYKRSARVSVVWLGGCNKRYDGW